MIAGIGVDIVEVDRIAEAIARHGDRFGARLFTPGEMCECWPSEQQRCRRLAARFAAKEATLKALGIGLRGVSWQEIEVVKDDLGKPSLHLTGRLAEIAAAQGITAMHLSLSHCKEYAMAQVVAEK
ncbi:MAG TPA: holo-ACP synthase [Symbiobacteriaceae bacterium]|nr:holo-ACP synthase [Symbiobacteriaceae bacterium]